MIDTTQKMQEALSRLPRTDTYPFSSKLHAEYDVRHMALSITPANVLLALHRAREAQALAVSYRDFRVGAAAVTLTAGTPGFQIVTGINVKPDQTTSMNVHAEQVALQKVDDRRFHYVSTLAVVGETQADTQSGHGAATLHPCGLCRSAIAQHPGIDPEHTLLASALPDLRTIELYNLASLQRFHDHGDESEVQRFDLPDLALLKPFTQETGVVKLDDSDEAYKDEMQWNSTVGAFVDVWRMNVLEHSIGSKLY